MNKKREILWRVWITMFFITLFGFAILYKAASIQIVQGPELRKLADSLTVFSREIEPERGNIYTENGDLLSTSLPFFEVRMDFRSEAIRDSVFNKNVDSLAIMFEKYIGKKSKSEYKKELIRNRVNGARYYLVKRNVKYPLLQQMKKWPFFREGRYKSGMIVLQKNERKNPFGMLAHRTIGYVRDEGKVKVGIEGKFDNNLKGIKGRILVQKISRNNYIPLNGKDDVQPETGQDVYLTIDVNMQDLVESALSDALKENKADHGTAVVMEVATGKIKAICNLGYNESVGKYIEDYNYAVGESTEPGSTFKLVSLAALLDDGYVKISDKVNLENGEKQYADRVMKDSHTPEQNLVTISEAFAHSSNVGISKLVNKYYNKKYKKFYNKLVSFHLNNPVGIEITGEGDPVIHPYKEWSKVSLPWMSIGYEVRFTPIQMLSFYNAIANNGKMMKPYLVSSIKEYDNIIEEFKPVVIDDKIVNDNTLKSLKKALKDVVKFGTAKDIKSKNVVFAGKTGTSQIANKKTNYKDKVYQASFAGFFPADNPKYSCIVVITNPTENQYSGGKVSAPVFAKIANKISANDVFMQKSLDEIKYINNEFPLLGNIYATDAENIYNLLGYSFHKEKGIDFGFTVKKDNSISQKANPILDKLMPNVVGMNLKDAFYVLENKGVKIRYKGRGKVVSQSIEKGTNIKKGQIVTLELEL